MNMQTRWICKLFHFCMLYWGTSHKAMRLLLYIISVFPFMHFKVSLYSTTYWQTNCRKICDSVIYLSIGQINGTDCEDVISSFLPRTKIMNTPIELRFNRTKEVHHSTYLYIFVMYVFIGDNLTVEPLSSGIWKMRQMIIESYTQTKVYIKLC